MRCKRAQLLGLFTRAPRAFWRFDIDLSLEAAVHMARIAQIGGITGTFYVMLRSPDYNPLSRPGIRALNDILDGGHNIGLHVDCRGPYRRALPQDYVRLDQAIADHIPQINQRLVSFHMPELDVLWHDFDEFENAYASKWHGRYLADSRGEWTPEKEAAVSNDMQINLHSEHWFGA